MNLRFAKTKYHCVDGNESSDSWGHLQLPLDLGRQKDRKSRTPLVLRCPFLPHRVTVDISRDCLVLTVSNIFSCYQQGAEQFYLPSWNLSMVNFVQFLIIL
jgi:hypothetical protein